VPDERGNLLKADVVMQVSVDVLNDPVHCWERKDAEVFVPVRRMPTEGFDESQDECTSRDLGPQIVCDSTACRTGKPHHAVSEHCIFARHEMRVIAWHIRLIRSGKSEQMPSGYF
jgi:hypothetical protein